MVDVIGSMCFEFIVLNFVECRFFLSWSKCPSSVAKDVPITALIFRSQIPVHFIKLLFLIAFDRVLKDGKKKDA